MKWAENCGDGLVDMGTPLGAAHSITATGSSPLESELTGHSILQAKSADAAKSLIENHPHLSWAEGCRIDLHEYRDMKNC
jgi:hypothetical protein